MPVSLLLLAFCHWGHQGSRHPTASKVTRIVGRVAWVKSTPAASGVVRFKDATAKGRGRPEAQAPTMDRGTTVVGPCRQHCCLVPCDHGCHCSWDSGVLCSATGFSGAVGSPAMVSRLGSWVPPPMLQQFCLLFVLQSTHFQMYRRVELSGILVCWTEEALLSYGCFTSCRLKERDRASHVTMMLTSLQEQTVYPFEMMFSSLTNHSKKTSCLLGALITPSLHLCWSFAFQCDPYINSIIIT